MGELEPPAIVVSAYNRPAALRRLLASLQLVDYAGGVVPLMIVVDGGSSPAVQATLAEAQSAAWPFGPKEVLQHPRWLGLQGNVFFCWGLAERFGSVIHLEDDIEVSPAFYNFATSALRYYAADERVGVLSLYALWFNGFTLEPFVPLPTFGDAFFVQVPFFQGLAFTRAQWRRFDEWRQTNLRPTPADGLHPMWLQFPETDWMPLMAKYLAQTGRFTVFPRVMLCAGTGEVGTHFARPTDFFSKPLWPTSRTFEFEPLNNSPAVYDAFFELLPDRLRRLASALAEVDFAVDLYATKRPENLRAAFTFTTRPTRHAAQTFGITRSPIELNMAEATPGREISLSRPQDLDWGRLADWAARATVAQGLGPPLQFSRRRALQRWLGRVVRRWWR